MKNCALIISFAIFLSACSAMVTSTAVDDEPGVIYALPKALIPVTLSLGSVPVFTAKQSQQRKALLTEERDLKVQLAKAGKDQAKAVPIKAKLAANKAAQEALVKAAKKARGLSVSAGTELVVPDSAQRFKLKYSPEIQSDDEIEIKTTESGLLELVRTKSADRSGDVLKKIAAAAADVAVFVSSGGFAPTGLTADVDAGKTSDCRQQLDFQVTALIDPANPDNAIGVLQDAAFGKTGRKCLDMAVYRDDGAAVENWQSLASESQPATDQCAKGVCYRRRGSIIYRFTHNDPNVAAATAILSVPQLGPVGVLDFNRRAFVETTAKAEFTNGMLTKVTYTDPSELLGFIGIPVDILETIFGIPAKLFETEQGQLDAQKSLLEAEAAIIDQRIKLLQKEEELDAIIKEAQESTAGDPAQ